MSGNPMHNSEQLAVALYEVAARIAANPVTFGPVRATVYLSPNYNGEDQDVRVATIDTIAVALTGKPGKRDRDTYSANIDIAGVAVRMLTSVVSTEDKLLAEIATLQSQLARATAR